MKYFLLLTLFFSQLVNAESLPNPLTLGDLLKIANSKNYFEKQQKLNIDIQKVALGSINDQYNLNANFDLSLANRSEYKSGENNSHAFVRLNKVLYDQNIEINKNSKLDDIESQSLSFVKLKQEKTIEVMQKFFDIVLADMNHETILEKLAIAAIREGRIKDDYDVQEASDVELLEKQTNTQTHQIKRIQAESEQIKTRANLAQILNIAYEDRPDDVVRPEFKHLFKNPLPEFETYKEKLFDNNIELTQLNKSIDSINKQISAHNNNLGLVVSSSARLGEQAYQRDKNGKWRVGLNLTIPIGPDDKKDRLIQTLRIKQQQVALKIDNLKQQLINTTLDYYLQLKTLRQMHKALTIELDYRDLFLEKARANYEMQIKSDIGNAMTNYTDSERKLAENEFNYAITLKKLHFLIGENYEI